MTDQPTNERGSKPMGQVLRIEPGAELGLEFPDAMTFEQWELEGRRLSQTSHALQWYIGDWWNAGVKFGDEKRAETAKRLFGLEYQTVRNLGSVCGRVPVYRRRDSLSFSHHAELVSIDDETKVAALTKQVEEQGLSVRDLRREVQAIKAANDPAIGAVGESAPPVERTPPPEFTRADLEQAYAHYIEAMQALEAFRKLTHRESDFLNVAMDFLGVAYADRRPPPDDFDVVLVEQGRVACEAWYNASRITVTRWLDQRGKRKLLDARADFVKFKRQGEYEAGHPPSQCTMSSDDDPMFLVAQKAAGFLRVNRYGGWTISPTAEGDWLVGTVRKTSDEVIAMAERQGWEPQSLGPMMVGEGH